MIRLLMMVVLAGALVGAERPWDRLEALLVLQEEQPSEAISGLRDLVDEYPEFHAAHYDLGCLLLAGDPAAAARHFRMATQTKDPVLGGRAEHNRALALFELGRVESALQAAEAAVSRQPDDDGYVANRDTLRTILIQRRDAARLAAEAAERQLRIEPTVPPPAWEGESWTHSLTGAGGDGGPYRFSLGDEQSWPEGLQMGLDGVISGTPAAETAGEHAIGLVITDGSDETAEGACDIIILPPPAILTTQLPEAVTDELYSASLRAQGFLNGQWQVTGLPAGLRQEGASIVGTPTAVGTSTLTLTIADAFHTQTATVDLLVSADSFAPAEEYLPDATNGYHYEARLTVRGKGTGYRWSGSAANGLAINDDGVVTGIPQQAGASQIPVTITNSAGEARHFMMPIRINPPPVISSDQQVSGRVGEALDHTIATSGGTRPFTWQVIGSTESLPAGVALHPDGHLAGIPQEAGSFSLAIGLTDRWEARTKATIAIEIAEPPQPGDQQEDGEQGEPGEQQDQGQDGEQPQDGDQQDGQQGDQSQDGEAGDQRQDDGQQQGDQQQAGDQGDQQQDGEQGDQDGDQEQDGQAGDQEREQGAEREDGQLATEGPDANEQVRRDMRRDAAARFLEDLPHSDQDRLLLRLLGQPERQADEPAYEGDPW